MYLKSYAFLNVKIIKYMSLFQTQYLVPFSNPSKLLYWGDFTLKQECIGFQIKKLCTGNPCNELYIFL